MKSFNQKNDERKSNVLKGGFNKKKGFGYGKVVTMKDNGTLKMKMKDLSSRKLCGESNFEHKAGKKKFIIATKLDIIRGEI